MMAKIALILVLIATTIQVLYSKAIAKDVAADLEKLHESIDEFRNEMLAIIQEDSEALGDYGNNLLVNDVNLLYATSTTKLLEIRQYRDVAEKFAINIDKCEANETEDRLRAIPTEGSDALKACMQPQTMVLWRIIYQTNAKIQMFEDTVIEIDDALKECQSDECMGEVEKAVGEKEADFVVEKADVLEYYMNGVKDFRMALDRCSDSIMNEAVMTMGGMTSDVVECIVEILAENGH